MLTWRGSCSITPREGQTVAVLLLAKVATIRELSASGGIFFQDVHHFFTTPSCFWKIRVTLILQMKYICFLCNMCIFLGSTGI